MDLLSDVDHITRGHLSEKNFVAQYISEFASERIQEVHILLIRDTVLDGFGCETIHPIQ